MAASAAKRATAVTRADADAQVAAARSAAAEKAVAVTSLPNGGAGATHGELLAALAARDVQIVALQGELSVARATSSSAARDKDRLVAELAAIEQRLLEELATAKASYDAAQQSAAEVANSAAQVMTALTAQLDAERSAREAAEQQLVDVQHRDGRHHGNGHSDGQAYTEYTSGGDTSVYHAARPRPGSMRRHSRRSEDSNAGGGGPFMAPGVLRGVAAGVAAGVVVRLGIAVLSRVNVTERTGVREGQRPARGDRSRDGRRDG